MPINPAFVTIDDEELSKKNAQRRPLPLPPPNISDVVIDYSKARKLPQVYAAISGTYSH